MTSNGSRRGRFRTPYWKHLPISRRVVLRAAGVALAGFTGVTASSVLTDRQGNAMVVAGRQRAGTPVSIGPVQWGEDPQRQWGQLYLPEPRYWAQGRARPSYPVVVFLHGGGWKDESGPSYCMAVGRDLARYGVAVWMPTYRGTPSPGGWPATFVDASRGLDFVARLGDHAPFSPDLQRVHLTGHSAGGHLAAWLAGRDELPGPLSGTADDAPRVTVRSTTPVAGVLDLEKAVTEDQDEFVTMVLGGHPEELPERYRTMSPLDQLPLSVPVNVVHGRADSVVPASTLRDYVTRHAQTRNAGQVVMLEDAEHNDFVNVNHRAWFAAREVCLASVGSHQIQAP